MSVQSHATVVRVCNSLIRAAKAGDIGADVALLDAAPLDRGQLIQLLRLLFPVIGELYATKAASVRFMDTLDEQMFAELSAQIDVDERVVLADVDPIGSVWKESDDPKPPGAGQQSLGDQNT